MPCSAFPVFRPSSSDLHEPSLCRTVQSNQSLISFTSIKYQFGVRGVLVPQFQRLAYSSLHVFLAADAHKASSAIIEAPVMRLPSIAGDPQEAQDKYPTPISPCEQPGSSEARNNFLRTIYCPESH